MQECDPIAVEDFVKELNAENFQFDTILADYLEVQPSLLLAVSSDELNAFYIKTVNERTASRQQLVNLVVDIWTNQYDEATPTSTSCLGNVQLLRLGTLYKSIRSSREKLSVASLILSLMDRSKPLFFLPDQVIDYSDPSDRILIEALEEYVQKLPEPDQVRYIDFASDEVKLNQRSCAYHLAHNAIFVPNESTTVNVFVLGEAGAGKSTLVNETFRDDLPPEKRCREGVGEHTITTEIEGKSVVYRRPVSQAEIDNGFEEGTMLDVTITMTDCPGLTREHMDNPQEMLDLTASIMKRISDGMNGKASAIDIILWVVPGTSSRLPKMDELFIRQLGALVPVCLVWTRAVLSQHINDFKAWLNDPKEVPVPLPICGMFEVYARREKCRSQYQESFGMAELGLSLSKIFNLESHDMRDKYINKLKEWTEADFLKRRQNSYRIVNYHSAGAAVIGASPIPYVDTVAVFMLQSVMILQINAAYGASLPRNLVSSLITTVITGSSSITAFGVLSLAGAFLLDFAGDTLKLLPGLNILGMALSGGCAAGLTAAVGYTFVNGVESLVREYPNLLDVPTDEIQKALLVEAEKTAKHSLNETRKRVEELAEEHEKSQ